MEVIDIRPALAPAISFACSAMVFLLGSNRFWRSFWMLSASTLKLAVVLSMLPSSLQGTVYVYDLIEFTPGIGLGFRADALGMFFAAVSSTLWLITTVYAIGYMGKSEHRVRFFGFFSLCVSTTVGIAFAGDLLTFFLFYEILTICTYPLVIHNETPDALKAGRKYLIYTLIGGAFILIGTVVVFDAAGTLSLGQPGILSHAAGVHTLGLIFALLITGFAVKAAIMPLHGWLPSAMVAPTPVSALLHAVAVVKAGAFGILRTVYNVFGVDLLADVGFTVPLKWVSAFTIIVASLVAIFQDDLKRRLAYSTISQLSYIALAAAMLTPLSAAAAIVHITNQAFAKITMFFAAGAIQRTTGKTNVHELAGIGYQMPWTMGAFTVASLSFVGFPLFAGFITKWYLSLGALESGEFWVLAIMIVSSMLNAAYFLPIVYLAFFKAPPGTTLRVAEARPTLLIPTLVCAAYVIALGTMAEVPGMPFSLAKAAVRFVFGM
ncbi:MAG TPA: monovalent cation/H+ antiporter subunit D family protein [Coriobacteriia bacterium]|nr:monovalent cation/H+ antiporter subunit D family protein [Coriobacteriia bacterium]